MELLSMSGLAEDDRIVALGDIVDRGPDSPAVLDFFRTHPNALSLMGNHERKHIGSFHGEVNPSRSQIMTRLQFTEQTYSDAVALMTGFPLFMEFPEAILVHASLEPGIPLEKQCESVLIGSMSGEHHMKRNYDHEWYELYDGDKPVIAGHKDYSGKGEPIIFKDKVFLIDTGCCYGFSLTGLILPDYSIISVKSQKNYWALAMQSRRKKF